MLSRTPGILTFILPACTVFIGVFPRALVSSGRVFDVESGECVHTLLGHTAEIVSLNFDTNGQRIMTGSFDHTVKGQRVILAARLLQGCNHRFLG